MHVNMRHHRGGLKRGEIKAVAVFFEFLSLSIFLWNYFSYLDVPGKMKNPMPSSDDEFPCLHDVL